MSFAKCFDVVTMVTEEATKQFGSLLRVDKEKECSLKACCEIIDDIAKEHNGISYEVEVDRDTTDITISLSLGYFEMVDDVNNLYAIISRTKRLDIKFYDPDTLQIDFVFKGIWSRAY